MNNITTTTTPTSTSQPASSRATDHSAATDQDRRTTDQDRRAVGLSASTGDTRFAGGWGPVLSGAVSAFLAFVILSSLLLAIAGTGVDLISDNFGWWELASALVAAPFGGYVAGRLQPNGNRMTAALQGFAAWGLLIIVAMFIGIPSGAALFSGATDLTLQGAAGSSADLSQFSEQLWGAFAVFAGGALLAALAGAAGARSDDHDGRVARHDRR